MGDNVSTNISNGTCEIADIELLELISYSPGEKFFVGVLMPILLCIGIIDNVAFMIVVARLPTMRTPTNCYLVNLAIADLIFLILAIGEKIWQYLSTPYNGNAAVFGYILGCALIPLTIDISYFASLCFITLVSFERYIAVCRPQSRGFFQRSVFLALLCIVSWVVSTALSASLILGNISYDYHCFLLPEEEPYNSYPDEFARCNPAHREIIYPSFLQTFPFFFSLILNIVLYIMIVKGLNQSIKRLRGHGSRKEEDTRVRDQIARMLILNGVIFFCCLVPFELLSILMIFRADGDFTLLAAISRFMSYLNSGINPIIFTTMSQRYREAFKATFLPQRCYEANNSVVTNGTSPPSTTNTYIKMTKTKT